MNRNRLHSLRNIAAALLACAGFTSCTQDELAEQGTPLPVGQYPLELTAGGLQAVAVPASAPSTRTTVDGTWESNMHVAVQVDGEGVKAYSVTPAGDGKTATLSSSDPFYWTNTSEKKTVTAWYPHSGTYPTAWMVKADQSSAADYQASDLIKGELQDLTFLGRDTKMTFEHQTAKVEIKLTATDGVALDGNTSVKLLNIAGVNNNGSEITPYRPDVDKQTYLALLGEQTITANTNFIQVTANDADYYYKPDADMQLVAGTAYTYNITVKADGIEVEAVAGGTWNNSNNIENITSTKFFNADDLKIGDYFYSDGTWSDGGLRTIYTDGSMKIATPKPDPKKDKTVVGIVFQTDKNRIGQAEKDKLGGEGNVHGLVMSLKDASGKLKWGPYHIYVGLTLCVTKADNYKDISGYGNCEKVRNREDAESFSPVMAAYDYNTSCSVSKNTTGWYLPSSGQWWDILQNLGGCTVLADEDQQTSSDSDDFSWSGQGDVPAALNAWMEKIASDSREDFVGNTWFWSSSEYSGGKARSWLVGSGGNVRCWQQEKAYYDYPVRAVLAF